MQKEIRLGMAYAADLISVSGDEVWTYSSYQRTYYFYFELFCISSLKIISYAAIFGTWTHRLFRVRVRVRVRECVGK